MRNIFIVVMALVIIGASYHSGGRRGAVWLGQDPGVASKETFSGSPTMALPQWNASDFQSYSKVTGTGSGDLGGRVFVFSIHENGLTIAKVECVGKVGAVAAGNQINYRVKSDDGTQVASGTITADTETTLVMSTLSPEPDMSAGKMIAGWLS